MKLRALTSSQEHKRGQQTQAHVGTLVKALIARTRFYHGCVGKEPHADQHRTVLTPELHIMAPKKKSKPDGTALQANKPTPNWPAFTPLIPESGLALEEVSRGQIVTIQNFWTATLCKNYVAFLSSLPLLTTPGKPKKGDAVRVNDRYQIDDPAFAERLWSGTSLKSIVEAQPKELWGGDVVGLNPNIRIYRYSKGQFFDQHCEHYHGVRGMVELIGTRR